MRAGRTDEPLDLFREVEQPLHVGLLLEIAQLGGHATRVGKVGAERDRLRDAVRFAVRHAENAGDVAHRGARQHRVERADLGDAVGAVLLRDVLDDFVAAVAHEVDVDVRRGEPLEVQKALEDEPVLQRIDVGHADRVVHDRATCRSAHRREDPLLVREPNEVLHDEDVSGVSGLRDDRELLVHPLAELRRDGAVLLDRAGLREGAQLLFGRLSVRDLEVREAQLAERQAQIDLLGDAEGVLERFVVVREELAHLRGRAHEQLGVVDHLEAVRRVDGLAALDTDHDVLRFGVLGVDIVDVVGDDEGNPGPARHLAHAFVHALLLGDAVRHELEVVVALPEDRPMLLGDRAGRVDALVLDRARQLALQAGREGDQALAALAKQVLVHPRTVVVALEVRRGDHRDQVLITGEVLREEDEVPRLAVPLGPRVAVEAVVAGDVGLDADDRLDAGVAAERVEVDGAVKRAVIGEAERRHVQGLRARDEVAEAGQPVEQAVLAMGVQMHEVLGDDPAPRVCRSRKRGG